MRSSPARPRGSTSASRPTRPSLAAADAGLRAGDRAVRRVLVADPAGGARDPAARRRQHPPSLLPRHRGPFPFAWAVREGDAELGMTVHLMDERFDTGPILAQGSRPMPAEMSLEAMVPTLSELAAELVPGARAACSPATGASRRPRRARRTRRPSARTTPSSTPPPARRARPPGARVAADVRPGVVAGPVATVGGGAVPRPRRDARRSRRPGASAARRGRRPAVAHPVERLRLTDTASHVRDAAAAAGSRPCDAGHEP